MEPVIINDFKNKKLVDYLHPNRHGRVLLVFNHGLGDLINFMPLYKALKSYRPTYRFNIGIDYKRGLHNLYPFCIPINDIRALHRQFTYIFFLRYPEPLIQERGIIIKPYLCNDVEIGIPDFVWEPYKMDIELKNENSKLVGFHFTGRTNFNYKNINFDKMKSMWDEIKEMGLEPYEIHMDSYNMLNTEVPSFINSENSLRFNKCNIKDIVNKISECKYFFGIDSGPFYLAGSILGFQNCIGMEKLLSFSWYLPHKINKINSILYNYGDIKEVLGKLENM